MFQKLSMRQKVLLSLVAGAVFLGLALWGIEWRALGEALGRTKWIWLVPTASITLAVHLWRVHRWWVLVNAARPTPFRRIAAHCLVGFLAITTLPFRAGELVRPFLLKSREGIPFSLGLATCVAERVFDILGMAVMLAIVLWAGLPADTISVGGTEVDLHLLSRIAFAFTLVGIAGIIAMIALHSVLTRLIEAVVGRVWEKGARLLVQMLSSFVDGLSFLRGFGKTAYVTASSVLIWLAMGVAMWCACQAMGLETIDIPAAEGVMAVTMGGIAIPAGPAFVGSYELFCSGALSLYGVPKADGIAVSLIMHMTGFIITVAVGLLALGGVTGLVELAKAAQEEQQHATEKSAGPESA